jgi:hypothetical protein
VVCETDSSGSGGTLAGGTNGEFEFQGAGNGRGAYLFGLTRNDVALVVVEQQNGNDVHVTPVPLPGYPGRVWVAPVDTMSSYRAIMFLRADGTVLRRAGRPPR